MERDDIWATVARDGYALYAIAGAPLPQWHYTVGLSGPELVLCGATDMSQLRTWEYLHSSVAGSVVQFSCPGLDTGHVDALDSIR